MAEAAPMTIQRRPPPKTADQRGDYDRRHKRHKRNAHNVGIDDDPQRRGKRGAQESEGVGPDSSWPQRGDVDVKLS